MFLLGLPGFFSLYNHLPDSSRLFLSSFFVVVPVFYLHLLPYPSLAPLPLSTPWPHSYWDSAYDDDVMENRVGLNLLYAQVSLELPQNPSPEIDTGVPTLQRKLFMSLLPVLGRVPRILSGHLATTSLLCKLL